MFTTCQELQVADQCLLSWDARLCRRTAPKSPWHAQFHPVVFATRKDFGEKSRGGGTHAFYVPCSMVLLNIIPQITAIAKSIRISQILSGNAKSVLIAKVTSAISLLFYWFDLKPWKLLLITVHAKVSKTIYFVYHTCLHESHKNPLCQVNRAIPCDRFYIAQVQKRAVDWVEVEKWCKNLTYKVSDTALAVNYKSCRFKVKPWLGMCNMTLVSNQYECKLEVPPLKPANRTSSDLSPLLSAGSEVTRAVSWNVIQLAFLWNTAAVVLQCAAPVLLAAAPN